MTIALLPRRANAFGRFTRLSSTVRETATHRALPQSGNRSQRQCRAMGDDARRICRPVRPPARPGAPRDHRRRGSARRSRVRAVGPVTLHLAGAWVGRVAFEGSTDGVTWSRLALAALDGGSREHGDRSPRPLADAARPAISFIRLRVTRLAGGAILAAVASAPVRCTTWRMRPSIRRHNPATNGKTYVPVRSKRRAGFAVPANSHDMLHVAIGDFRVYLA